MVVANETRLDQAANAKDGRCRCAPGLVGRSVRPCIRSMGCTIFVVARRHWPWQRRLYEMMGGVRITTNRSQHQRKTLGEADSPERRWQHGVVGTLHEVSC